MENITTPEMFVAAAAWKAMPKYTDKQKSGQRHVMAQCPVWTTELHDALPETVRLAVLNHSSSSPVMARDIVEAAIVRGDTRVTLEDLRLRFARRIFGLRSSGGGVRVVVETQTTLQFPGYSKTFKSGDEIDGAEVYAEALAASIDLGIPQDVARTMIEQTLDKMGIEYTT